MKKKVYISLPISGRELDNVKEEAAIAKSEIESLGFEAVTPFEISPDENASYATHMGNDIAALLECDAIVLLHGWEQSKGCNLEMQAAQIYQKPTFMGMEHLKYMSWKIGGGHGR